MQDSKSTSGGVSWLIWITCICSQFPGCPRSKQPCLTAVTNQKYLLHNGLYTSIAIVALHFRNIFAFRCWKNLTRPSCTNYSLSRFIDHMCFDMVDHVPSNIPESSFTARLYISEDNEPVIRTIIQGRRLKLRRVSRTHRVDLDWLFAGTNLDSSISTRYLRTTEQ